MGLDDPNDELEVLFEFLWYWELQHIRDMHKAFMFDSRHRVNIYVKKLKGILNWIFWMLEHVGIISSSAYSSFLMALQYVPLPT